MSQIPLQTIAQAPEELNSIVASVFETMLDIEARPSFEVPSPQGEMVTASVFLTGAYQGAVLVHCPPWQACGFAAQYAGSTPPSQVDDDVLDFMGEMANMVAGNLKSSLLPGTHISLPSVTQGVDAVPRLCGGRPIQRAGFQTPLGPVWVTMFNSAVG